MNCATCWKALPGDKTGPYPCDRSKECIRMTTAGGKLVPASVLMHPELGVWLELFFMLGGEPFKRDPFELLDRAGATEADFDVLMHLRSVHDKWVEDHPRS